MQFPAREVSWEVASTGDMFFRQHALMQDTHDENAPGFLPVKYHMPAVFHSPQTGTNILAGAAQSRTIGQRLATRLQAFDVTYGLVFAPSVKGVGADLLQVGFGAPGETERGHWLASRHGQLEVFSDTGEDIALGDAAGIAFVDGSAERG
jgi:hypothetical protein